MSRVKESFCACVWSINLSDRQEFWQRWGKLISKSISIIRPLCSYHFTSTNSRKVSKDGSKKTVLSIRSEVWDVVKLKLRKWVTRSPLRDERTVWDYIVSRGHCTSISGFSLSVVEGYWIPALQGFTGGCFMNGKTWTRIYKDRDVFSSTSVEEEVSQEDTQEPSWWASGHYESLLTISHL